MKGKAWEEAGRCNVYIEDSGKALIIEYGLLKQGINLVTWPFFFYLYSCLWCLVDNRTFSPTLNSGSGPCEQLACRAWEIFAARRESEASTKQLCRLSMNKKAAGVHSSSGTGCEGLSERGVDVETVVLA